MDDTAIWLYSLSTCGTCKRVEKLLQRTGCTYEVVTVDLLGEDQKGAIIELLRAMNPRLSFPTLVAGDTVIVGYREAEILAIAGKPPGFLQRLLNPWLRA